MVAPFVIATLGSRHWPGVGFAHLFDRWTLNTTSFQLSRTCQQHAVQVLCPKGFLASMSSETELILPFRLRWSHSSER